MPDGHGPNRTPPVAGMAAASYLTTTLAPHAADLADRLRETESAELMRPHLVDNCIASLEPVHLYQDVHCQPLLQLSYHAVERRSPGDATPHNTLLTINWKAIARQAGYRQKLQSLLTHFRHPADDTPATGGTANPWARNTAPVSKGHAVRGTCMDTPTGPNGSQRPGPHRPNGRDHTVAAMSVMRVSELCRPPEHYGDGLVHARVAHWSG